MNTLRLDSGIYEDESDRSRGNSTSSDDTFLPRERTVTSATCHSLEDLDDDIDTDGDQQSSEVIDDFVVGGPGIMPPNTPTNSQTGKPS